MGKIDMENVCTECGGPLNVDDDDICTMCVQDLDDAIRNRFRNRLMDDRDGKRLDKSRRPKHRPTPEREIVVPDPPKTTRPERETSGGSHPPRRPPPQAGGRPQDRRQ